MISSFLKPRLSYLLKLTFFLIVFGIFSNYLIKKSSKKITKISIINSQDSDEENNFVTRPDDQVFTTDCECKKDTQIVLRKINKDKYSVNLVQSSSLVTHYTLSQQEFNDSQFTCNHYNTFKRGKNQKIIGYSLYGTGHLFYYNFVNLVKTASKLHPDWILRVYYDKSIDLTIKCKIECLKHDQNTNKLLDNVDFCSAHAIPVKQTFDKTWDASYMHAMMWRWLPIGDSFVDVFSSRDLDSHLLQREVDAVNAWLKSNSVGHIMRDHPQHATHILGGMWGFYNSRNRELASSIYNKITDKSLAAQYNQNSKKGLDQFFLSDHVYAQIKDKSLIHDSFLCNLYRDSSPYPSQRQGALFVSFGGPVNELDLYTYNKTFHAECPVECRPKDHQEWKTC